MLVDHCEFIPPDIHRVKCYIVVIQEIGNITLRSKLVIETLTEDFFANLFLYVYSQLLNRTCRWKHLCLAKY